MKATPKQVSIGYFSDLLCVWAYVAQVKIDELRRNFPGQVSIDYRFVPIFGDALGRIGERWSDRGGLAGYAGHVGEVASRFEHAPVHPEVWTRTAPVSSLTAHAFVRAAFLLAREGTIDNRPVPAFAGRTAVEQLSWQLRVAFFRDLRDIGRLDVQLEVAEEVELPADEIRRRLEDGSPFAALTEDHDLASRFQINGSPTFLINEGRQKLYGNVGYRIIEANVQELLRDNREMASWC